MLTTEAFWVPHCDDASCSLGGFEYECPVCHSEDTDYQVWFEFDNVLGGDPCDFNCSKCQAPLVVYWDAEELETRVKPKEQ